MNESLREIEIVVDNLNIEIDELSLSETHYFAFTYGANVALILIGDRVLWNSENDERDFDETKNEYEPLEEYVKKQFNDYVDSLVEMKFPQPPKI